MTRAVVIHLGRTQAQGERRRVGAWLDLLDAAGIDAQPVTLSDTPLRGLDLAAGLDVVRGRRTPESAVWRATQARAAIDEVNPDLVVIVSLRSFAPQLLVPQRRVVLDYVDRLSLSYASRGRIMGGARGLGYSALAHSVRRSERRPVPGAIRVAAGWADARALGATWFPVLSAEPRLSSSPAVADTDLTFVGTLRYPPNVEAVRQLAAMWPRFQAVRPGISLRLAGADPVDEVRALARRNRWSLEPNFDDLRSVMRRTRLSVAPLRSTAGIQIKVLDAAALGVPQVVTADALAGFDPEFPVPPTDLGDPFVERCVQLLEDGAMAAAAAKTAADHVDRRYRNSSWVSWVQGLVREDSHHE